MVACVGDGVLIAVSGTGRSSSNLNEIIFSIGSQLHAIGQSRQMDGERNVGIRVGKDGKVE